MAEAELGVVIKTEGAEEGAASLDKFSVSAKGAADATNDLSLAQTKVRGGLGIGGLGAGLDTNITRPLKAVDQSVTATGKSIGFLQSLWQGMKLEFSKGFAWDTGFGMLSEGAKDATSSIGSTTKASQLFREGIYLLNPVLGSFGTQLSGIRGYASLARTGFLGIAAAITTVLITALEKATEAADLTERSLKHLLDSAALSGGAGAKTFDEMKASADRMGVSINSLREGVGALSLALQRSGEGPKWIGDAPAAANNAVKAFEAFSDAIRVDQKDMTSATKIATEFVNSLTKIETAEQKVSKLGMNWQIENTLTKIQKNAGLTLDAFISLEKTAPFFASTIAQAFNTDIAGMEKLLSRGPIALQDMLLKLGVMVPKIQAELAKLTPTVTGGWDQFTTAVGKLWAEIGKTSGIKIASTVLETLTDRVKKMNEEVAKGAGAWQAFKTAMPSGGDVGRGMMAGSTESITNLARTVRDVFKAMSAGGENIRNEWRIIVNIALDAWNSILRYISSTNIWQMLSANARVEWETIVQIALNAWERIRSGINNIWSGFSALASAAWNTVAQSANSVWTAISAGAKAAADAASQYVMGIVQGTVNKIMQLVSAAASALARLRGSTAGDVGYGGPGISFDASGNPATYTGYASGGAFQVSGPGGTDSVPVRFMATPGEVVTITPSNLTSPSNIAGMVTANLPATTLSQGGATATGAAPAKAITDPITFAVKDSSGKIVGAVNDATAAIKSMAENIARAAEGAGGGAIGGATGGVAGGYTYRGKAGSAAGPLGSGPIDAYGYIVPSTQAVYIARINYNSAIAGMPQGPGNPVYAVNPNYRGAEGGTWAVRGLNSGTDALSVGMKLTAGELVKVTPQNEINNVTWAAGDKLQSLISVIKTNADNATNNMIAIVKKIESAMNWSTDDRRRQFGSEWATSRLAMASASWPIIAAYAQNMQTQTGMAKKTISKDRSVVINNYIYGATNPIAFVSSEAAIKRSVRRAMG